MFKFKNYYAMLKFVILISIFASIYFEIYLKYANYFLLLVLHFSLISIVALNGYFINIKKNRSKYSLVLLFFNICASSILQYTVAGISTFVYGYVLISEIFQFKRSIIKILLPIHFSLFFLVLYLDLLKQNHISVLFVFSIVLLSYLGITGMLYNWKMLEIEKEEIKQLNKKLKLANLKLQEHALEVEEVTIAKERTRVSQELHDSLGHSLMALAMHLEFAKKICAATHKK